MSDDEDERVTTYSILGGCSLAPALAAGSIMSAPRIFSDMAVMKRRRPVSSAPRWRVYGNGLNLEGYCQNSSCEAYNQSRVIIPLGYRDFRFNIDSYLCKCPLCGSRVREETCGFCNAEYKYSGFQAINDDAKEVNSSWQDAPDGFYTTFDDGHNHFVKWFQLKIEVRRR
ncbi:145_t:CDS:2 [Ambispora leptoticha]|uniref:145_t:CDS:1 n=1 Tax=Ambispora leptoticha TaxID=144679 RepID=A0A9N9CS46_9GLOM|nr:145_t:CDS:2 [Ambispora leptoticha]